MSPVSNLPLLLNSAYYGYNRALPNSDGSRGDFQPQFTSDGNSVVTYCNEFIQFICNCFGYSLFNGMDANDIVGFMLNPTNGWITVADDVAQAHANAGRIVIAGHMNPGGHGHVCLVVPGIAENSNSYGKSVPKVVNVGKDVFFGKRVSFSFQVSEMPQYFVLGCMVA